MDTVLLYILGVVVVLLGVAISIALHEVGHLVPAKRFGVKVGQYMIGFGPTIFSRRFGETEYGIKAIPLGGYISMAGMYPPEKQADGEILPAEDGAPGDPVPIKPRRARVGSTSFFDTMMQDARASSAKDVLVGEEERVFYKLSWWKRIIIMLGGPVMNLLIGVVLYGVILCAIGIQLPTPTIASVSECVVAQTAGSTDDTGDSCEGRDASPAAAAGLEPGDTIVSIDGKQISSWDAATAVIRDSADTPLDVVVERDGAEQTLRITPLPNELYVYDDRGNILKDDDGNDRTQVVGFVGMSPSYARTQQPVTAVLPAVGDNIARVAGIVVTLPQRLVQVAQAAFGGEERDPNGPISVVGVGRLAGEISSLDTIPVVDRISTLIGLVASLNIALFVFNLIPLLPLDGGHVIGAVWEALRRRLAKLFRRPEPGPVDIAKLIPLTMTIVAILGVSSALLIYADIVNPVKLF